ncbi:unnamed protein product [Miscanthus lutarioriparius]|uniref:Dirigent protein n=1 Tax=Miscanthus lutarioriparius TaxID=422564 RepID=A0A811Q0J0_9POAL|nr:unnamed protein product [Miscanthus lutarioriparius]CAD6252402.1 unnamed protein product [Miscanthus lutarioriparius]
MAYSATAPCAAAQYSELKMTLYTNKEVYYSGPDNNGVTIIDGSKMGTTWVFSWPVADGATPDANIVGHLQGTGVQVANTPNLVYHYSLGLVFEDKRFNGSTLQIQGTSQINGEWSIVGGTGLLTMAMGTVKRTSVVDKDNTRISELKIHAYLASVKPTTTSVCIKAGNHHDELRNYGGGGSGAALGPSVPLVTFIGGDNLLSLLAKVKSAVVCEFYSQILSQTDILRKLCLCLT